MLVKTQMSVAEFRTRDQLGFTLIELMVVMAVLAIVATLSGPSLRALSASVEYQEAVRGVTSAVRNARLDARSSGAPVDLVVDPINNRFALTRRATELNADDYQRLAEELHIEMTYAAEVSPGGGIGAIRFYPSGGSSGGEIMIQRPSGTGTRLTVDWLLGEVNQEIF